MGFFKKLFKRKKGGTFFGNILRGVSSKVTGGVLGSGVGLANWEAKQAEKEQQEAIRQAQAAAKQQGAQLAQKLIANQRSATPTEITVKEKAEPMDMVKKYWWVGLIAFALYYMNKQNQPRRGRR